MNNRSPRTVASPAHGGRDKLWLGKFASAIVESDDKDDGLDAQKIGVNKTAMTCTYPRSPYPRPCAYAHPTPDPVPVEILLRIYTQHRKQGRPSPNSHDATLPLIFPFPSVPSLPLPALPYSPFPSSPSPLLSLSLLSHPSFPWT